MTKERLTVLVTSVGSTTALSVIKGLRKDRRRSYRVIGTDASELALAGGALCDVFCHLPHGRTGWYIGALREILEREQVDVFIPIIDCEIELIAKQRGALGAVGQRALLAPYAAVKTCNDKERLYTALSDRPEFGAPRMYDAGGDDSAGALPFPLFMKPRRGISSVDCFKINDAPELEVLGARVEHPVVCDFLPGDQYVIDTLSDGAGHCLASVPRREFEAKAGVGVKAQISMDEALVEYGRRLVEALGIVGPACIEVMKHGDRIGLIEVNPRVSACLVVTIEAGVNIPALIVDLVLGRRIHGRRLRVERPTLYMTRYWNEVYFERAERE